MATDNHTAISTNAALNAATVNSPLAELDAAIKKNEDAKAAAPGVNDDSGDGYSVGSDWHDTTNDEKHTALDVTVGAAVWGKHAWQNLANNFSVTQYIGDTANSKMTLGATFNQANNDDEILAFKSSDVAHGMTTLAEADTFASFTKVNGTAGGLLIRGYRDSDGAPSAALMLSGRLDEAADTGKLTTSKGIVSILAEISDGTGTSATMTADGNLLSVSKNSGQTTVWILDEDGDIFYGGSDDGAISDDYDDVSLLTGFRALMSPTDSPAHRVFRGFLDECEAVLVQQGVLSAPRSEGGMVSDTGLKGLIIDGMRQIVNRQLAIEQALTNVGIPIPQLEAT